MSIQPPKKSPAVLLTDARSRPQDRSSNPPSRSPSAVQRTAPGAAPRNTRISVDNVLQYASDIPSGQPRGPPPSHLLTQQRQTTRMGALIRRPSQPSVGMGMGMGMGESRGLPTLASARTGQQNVPSRTTKVSEKLVLLPETDGGKGLDEDEEGTGLEQRSEEEEEEFARPLTDEELDVLRKRGGIRGKSYAERLPKVERSQKVARVTAYCTAQAYKLEQTAEFLKKRHEAKTKRYDDCLYVAYHLPLLPGHKGYRLRSRPVLRTPGTGKTLLDIEIERSENRDEHMGVGEDGAPLGSSPGKVTILEEIPHRRGKGEEGEEPQRPLKRIIADTKNFGEVFIFSYGVVVFWNFSEMQEKDILADLTFAENEMGVSLANCPLSDMEVETEEFHFEYSADINRPRVFNDMITLLPRSDHMVRLTISHAIAQSTKLCFFEERMSETMLSAQHVPKTLATTGNLNMTRGEIVKILGRLFKSRVDINLCSNILDVPNFFWDSEPTLHPLYVAIREYLEIDQRIKVLNERCRVFLDLADILADSIADSKMSNITVIIIVLIVVSIVVTVSEVVLRVALLKRGSGGHREGDLLLVGRGQRQRLELRGLPEVNASIEDLRLWGQSLSEGQKTAVCGSDVVGRTFAGV